MARGTVVSLCDRTGLMVRPWVKAGYKAITVDWQPRVTRKPYGEHIVADVRDYMMDFVPAMVFAFPPCTDLANSGARWFKDKGMGRLIEALEVVERCRHLCEANGQPWMLENPTGMLSTYWREPDYSFQPCDYGDPYTKKTCIWCGNGFVMPPIIRADDMFAKPTAVDPSMGSMMHTLPQSGKRGEARSVTPGGFAEEVFKANAR